jgi:hypothetical protein
LNTAEDTLGTLVVDGIEFSVAKAIISKSQNESWDLEVFCKDRRVSRLGDEVCAAYLSVEGLRLSERTERGNVIPEAESVDEWNRTETSRVNGTYFTLFGEGFSVLSAQIEIRQQKDESWLIRLHGVTDYPLHSNLDDYEVSLEAKVEVSSP